MNIDMSTRRGLAREKDIAFDLVCEAIEAALLTAYHHTEGSASHARVELDRKTGAVTVWAQEEASSTGELRDATAREYEATPAGFGRVAARTAHEVILQRPRGAEQELTYGEYAGSEGDVVTGVSQQHDKHDRASDRPVVFADLGK